MRKGRQESLKALIGAMTEAESKSYYEEAESSLNELSGLLKTFLNKDGSPERVRNPEGLRSGCFRNRKRWNPAALGSH